MATYKIKKKTAANGTTEEILLPISSIDGLQTELDGKQESGSYVTTNTTQTIPANKTYTGTNTFSNGKFSIRANSANDDSWIQLTNSGNSAYYAFGIRRPYTSYGLQLKYHPDTSNQDSSRPGEADGTSDIYYNIYHQGNYTTIPTATTSVAGLMSAADKTKADTHTHTVSGIPSAISSSFTGASMTSTGTFKPSGSISAISHTPAGTVSKPNINVSSDTSSFLNKASLSASLASDVLTLSVVTDEANAMTSATASLESAPTFTGTAFSVTPTFTGESATVSVSGTTTGSVSSSISSTTTKTTSQPS